MGKRYTQKEFEDALHKLYPNVIITGEYCGSSKKISFICPICGKEHESLAQSLMKGHFCKSNIGHNNPFKKDIDSFIAEIKSVDKDIIILGKYVNANTPIDVICSCGNIFKKQPAQLLLGHTKCPECTSGKILWGKCKDILNKIAPKMVLISDFKNEQYISQKTSIDYICECGEKDKKSIKFLL
jgi:hypothetical protein